MRYDIYIYVIRRLKVDKNFNTSVKFHRIPYDIEINVHYT